MVDLNQALLNGIKDGHVGDVEYYISKGADIHAEEEEAFITACMYGNLEAVIALVKAGVDINARGGLGIILASENYYIDHNIELVDYLVYKGIKVDSRIDDQLINSCKYGYYYLAKLLIDAGADVDTQDGLPLTIAIDNNNYKIIYLLVINGVYISKQQSKTLIGL